LFFVVFSVAAAFFVVAVFLYSGATPAESAVDNCCYHECNLGSPNICQGDKVMECRPDCDSDIYQDWCEVKDCAATGQTCSGGACVGAPPPSPATCSDGTPAGSCSSASGPPKYCDASGNLVDNCSVCGCSGSWVCSSYGTFCCDNTCNSSCYDPKCTAAEDPDCACQDGDGCCGVGCTNVDDSDCAAACTPDGCNDNCPTGCTVSDDPDCGSTGCCGDGTCDAAEDCSGCPGDCGSCTCTENWTCTAWSACSGGTQTRTCTDSNSCGTTNNKPPVSRDCLLVAINSSDAAPQGKKIYTYINCLKCQEPLVLEYSTDKEGVVATSSERSNRIDTASWALGTHSLTCKVTDANGLSASDSMDIEIIDPNVLSVNIKGETRGRTDNYFYAYVDNGDSPYTFEWESDKEGVFMTDKYGTVDMSGWSLGEHVITFTATDDTGAQASDTAVIEVKDYFIARYYPKMKSMEKEFDIYFNIKVEGGQSPYTYKYESDLDGLLAQSGPKSDKYDSFSKDDLSLGLHTISYEVVDKNGVTATATGYVEIDSLTPITVQVTKPADNYSQQQGSEIDFDLDHSGGVYPNNYSWRSDIDGVVSNKRSFSKNDLSVGTHQITAEVSDDKGNSGSSSITLDITSPQPLQPVISSPGNNSDFQAPDDIVTMKGSVTGGVNPYTYSWSSDRDGQLSTSTTYATNQLSQGAHTLTFTVTDAVGNTQQKSVNIQVKSGCSIGGTKDAGKYSSREAFLVNDSDWRSVVQLVPVTTYKQGNSVEHHPGLVFHEEPAGFDADSIIHFLQMFDSTNLTTVNSIPSDLNNLLVAPSPTGAGMQSGDIRNISDSDYFSFWSSFDSVVAADYNDYKAALIASLVASNLNSPLILVDSSNIGNYSGAISGKSVYTVGNLDSASMSQINSNAGCVASYTVEEAQKWYAVASESDKMVLVNPKDLGIKYSQSYSTQKAGSVSNLFSRMSLAAPFLAAAREEVIAFTELSDPGDNTTCNDSTTVTNNSDQADADAQYAIENLFVTKPKFLTVVASPQAIPDSVFDRCTNSSSQHRIPQDWRYGSLGDSHRELNPGRIYGLTVSDASSNIARSLNYSYLVNQIYGNDFNSISVGHSFYQCNEASKFIRDKVTSAGYDGLCFVGSDRNNCTTDKKPPYGDYADKNYISFCDHGSNYRWYRTLKYDQIPWLDLPVGMGAACSTNNYWQSHKKNFGAHMLRRGAIAYIGASGISYSTSLYMIEDAIKELSQDSSISLGGMYKKIYYSDYYLLGDPALKPDFPAISW